MSLFLTLFSATTEDYALKVGYSKVDNFLSKLQIHLKIGLGTLKEEPKYDVL